ncbi:hypothetical protein FHW96_004592 [Novosphingobium sp. SG751A]|uniref:hypothetical protein n=1 Tax=Novosphingobium sp. SG751A TaxID=2587000 RepID=UPI0035302BEE|nr:hypothetical protein [Novosphingobium sp. SG751A]
MKLDWIRNPDIEAMIEQRVAERAQSQAFQWRLRLMIIETFIMGGLVIAGGLVLGRPGLEVLRAGTIVAAACFASGLLLIGVSAACGIAASRFRQWRSK